MKEPNNANALQMIAIQQKCIDNQIEVKSIFVEEIKVSDFKKMVDNCDPSIA